VDVIRFEPIARRQHGLITRAQAVAAGCHVWAWYRALASEAIVKVHAGVARLPGAFPTPQQTILAGVLAAGPGAMASHRSAALLWGAEIVGDRPVDVTVPRRRHLGPMTGVVLHHPRDRDDLVVSRRDGIACTNPLRTLVDLGAVAPESVPAALAGLMTSGFVSTSAVWAVLDRHARSGRNGITALRQALAEWNFEHRSPDSELEIVMMAMVAGSSLPRPEFHARILGIEVDFVFADAKVVVEYDGWQVHGRDRVQFERDRERDARLVESGYVVLRLTWNQIVRRPSWVAARIAGAIACRSASGRPAA
jgi:very-short-patch-repair endonuclease